MNTYTQFVIVGALVNEYQTLLIFISLCTWFYLIVFYVRVLVTVFVLMNVCHQETTQIVYNWQFIHSLSLWTRLICELNSDEFMHSLIYPLTQIIIGTIKLVHTTAFVKISIKLVHTTAFVNISTDTDHHWNNQVSSHYCIR